MMLRWALMSMAREPLVFGLTAGAVGGVFLLVLLFEAVFAGEAARIVAYPEHMNADIWVMQAGVSNMHMASSLIWDSTRDRVQAIEGVSQVTPILYLNSTVLAGGKRWFAYIIGIEPGNGRAGPWALTSGHRLRSPRDIVIPAVVGRLGGVELGDPVYLSAQKMTVVGFSRDTFSMANSVMFVTVNALRETMTVTASYSYLLVDLAPGQDATRIARRIEAQVDGVHAMTAHDFIRNDRSMALQMGVQLIRLMTAIGIALAVVLTGFSVHSFLVRKMPELVVLKALGGNTAAMAGCVVVIALAISIAGVAIALALGFAAERYSDAWVPQISLRIESAMLLRLGAFAIISAAVAALVAASRLARVDPAAAFKV